MAERKKNPPKTKQRYTCKYQDKWTVEYPWVCNSRQGIEHAFCKVCVIDPKLDHGGKNDLRKHSITEKHTRLQKSQNTTSLVANVFFYSECRYRRCNSKRNSVHKFRCGAQLAVCCGRPFYTPMQANVPRFENS